MTRRILIGIVLASLLASVYTINVRQWAIRDDLTTLEANVSNLNKSLDLILEALEECDI